jgi:signal recognition particle subunit SEC65
MVSRGEDKYVIWPIYFDKTVSRLKGRKVSKKHATEKYGQRYSRDLKTPKSPVV